jgi:hypothetical protein
MTYSESIRDIKERPREVTSLSRVFSSFLDVRRVSGKQAADQLKDLTELIPMLEKKFFSGDLSKQEKIDLADYVERLQLTRDVLEAKLKNIHPNSLRRAAEHLGKKMQSSFSD